MLFMKPSFCLLATPIPPPHTHTHPHQGWTLPGSSAPRDFVRGRLTWAFDKLGKAGLAGGAAAAAVPSSPATSTRLRIFTVQTPQDNSDDVIVAGGGAFAPVVKDLLRPGSSHRRRTRCLLIYIATALVCITREVVFY